MLYPVILAGGSGQRLWPLSTINNPKQVRPILGQETLLQLTYQRLLAGFAAKDIFSVYTQNLQEIISSQIDLPVNNLIAEPTRKETAVAIGLAAVHLLQRDPDATMVTVNSDAFIKETEEYINILKQASLVVDNHPDKFLLIGIKPSYPETGYGYIHLSPELVQEIDKYKVYSVQQFKEKPDLETAKQYLAAGDYLWNPAMFVFKAKSLLEWYKQFLPKMYQSLMKIDAALIAGDDEAYLKILQAEYAQLNSMSIDYGLLEKLDQMLVMPADLTWADIGHWRALRDVQLIANNLANVSNSQHIDLDSKNNLLYSANNKLVATIGIENTVLVETDEVIFLCAADRAQDVKDLLKKLSDSDLEKYL
jgi:mannose-1-phosphate guanylyltransferase